MKKLASLFLALTLVALCLAGCGGKETLAEPEFPLTDEAITAALAQAELDWVIDPEGTHSGEEGTVLHNLRAPDGTLRGGTLSGVVDGKRYLSMTLPINAADTDPAAPRPFTWADCEQSLRLAALLYGGFEDAGALYDAFSEEPADLSEGRMTWDKELSGVFCRVTARSLENTRLPSGNVLLVVSLYEGDLDALREKYANAKTGGPEIVNTVETAFATYYELSDGTWMLDDVVYQYRLELSGRMPNAAADSTFVYLSNLPDISFEQAYKAAGVSSSTDDYFAKEDAVLVEMK